MLPPLAEPDPVTIHDLPPEVRRLVVIFRYSDPKLGSLCWAFPDDPVLKKSCVFVDRKRTREATYYGLALS